MYALFKHRKSKKTVEVPFIYNWGQNKIWCTYLGRTFWDSEHPCIGRNWEYLSSSYKPRKIKK